MKIYNCAKIVLNLRKKNKSLKYNNKNMIKAIKILVKLNFKIKKKK